MKLLKLSILFLSVLFLSSCGDDDCEAPALSENIVGKWEVVVTGLEAEFQADGTLIDPDGAFIEGELNGVELNEKSYTIDGNTLNVKAASGSQFVEGAIEISNIECDEMTATIFGIASQMKRK